MPEDSLSISSAGISLGGLTSVLEDSVSPAFGATIIILVTVIVAGGAYLYFLRYVCGGCCQPLQVEPTADGEGNKVEEQVWRGGGYGREPTGPGSKPPSPRPQTLA